MGRSETAKRSAADVGFSDSGVEFVVCISTANVKMSHDTGRATFCAAGIMTAGVDPS